MLCLVVSCCAMLRLPVRLVIHPGLSCTWQVSHTLQFACLLEEETGFQDAKHGAWCACVLKRNMEALHTQPQAEVAWLLQGCGTPL